jgi:aspartate 1-decarboxylase
LTTSGGPITASGTITLAGTLVVGNGGTGLATTPTNGQLLIGNGTGYTLAGITAGAGITVTNGAGSITIASTALLGTNFVTREVPTGSVNSSNRAFTLANTPVAGSEEVYVNGVLQNSGSGNDYVISTNTITFEVAATPQTGDVILVNYRK